MTRLPDEPPRSLRLNIDREALAANWLALHRMSGEAEAGAAVKSDAYGLGVEIVVPILHEAGARHFFLAHWSEVPAVLNYSEGATVSVLHGVRTPEEAAFAQTTGAIPVINSLRQAVLWKESGGGTCHLMIDTGINRLGIEPSEVSDPAIRSLDIDTVMSHLACADEDSAMNARQLATFRKASAAVQAKRRSLANSAGIALGPQYHFDLTRPGLALYGGIAHPALADVIKQVAQPQAAVIQMRDLSPGDSVGYNAIWTAEQSTRAATISIGYADGLMRAMGPGGSVSFDGWQLPVIGKVSMDMIVVDAGNSALAEGDFVDIPLNLPETSARSGLSQYEILTSLGIRYSRS
ncbi:MAG: alanine racemase [Alteraurantiacibacter sp.]